MSKNVPATKDENKQVSTAGDNSIPEYMRGKQGAGTENLGTTDMEVPRIKLIQAISPELETFNGLKAGEFFHTMVEESLGKSLRITPIYTDRRYILWKPRKSGGGILARADDGINWFPANTTFDITLPETKKTVKWSTKNTVEESGLAEWGSYDPENPDSQPAATLMYTFVVAMPDYPELGAAMMTLQRGSVKVARNLIGKIKIHKAPSYGRIFKVESTADQNKTGDTFYNYRFTADGFVPPEMFTAYEALYGQFKDNGLSIKDLDSMQEEGGNESSGGKPAGKSAGKDF